jgi:hypothetical protein
MVGKATLHDELCKLRGMNCVVHINGWPGSGKRTIGAIIAGRIGGRLRQLAIRRNARLLSVVLGISSEENIRRLVTPCRSKHRKLTRPEVLRQQRERYRLLRPAEVEVFDLDVTQLTAGKAAAQILEQLRAA